MPLYPGCHECGDCGHSSGPLALRIEARNGSGRHYTIRNLDWRYALILIRRYRLGQRLDTERGFWRVVRVWRDRSAGKYRK